MAFFVRSTQVVGHNRSHSTRVLQMTPSAVKAALEERFAADFPATTPLNHVGKYITGSMGIEGYR
jgi:hypothetical protein